MPEERIRHDVLARITGTAQLAAAVPRLPPEVLHAIVEHCGLQDCGALIALATPRQLAAVFDLDLWSAARAGADQLFDAERFVEWLEVLVEADPDIAAAQLAQMDVALVAAGLSPSISVWDPGAFEPVAERSSAGAAMNPGRERGVHVEIGGYVLLARRHRGWEVILDALVALESHDRRGFDRVMCAVRRLSNAGRELDGLDNLASPEDQARFDLSLGREERRDRAGFLPPDQARAFLRSARRAELAPSGVDPVFAAWTRAQETASRDRDDATNDPPDTADAAIAPSEVQATLASVMAILHDGGVLDPEPRALLTSAGEHTPGHAALEQYLAEALPADDAEWTARQQALAFLANALVAGGSVQGRPFTPREARDAVKAVCNLGLDTWPPAWGEASRRDVVTVFRAGWAVLHRDVSMAAAATLAAVLGEVSSSDRDLQLGLRALRREVRAQHAAGTPWRLRDRLDVLATLDLASWAALTSLFDQCPVMLANVSNATGRPALRVDPSEFEFIATSRHIAAVGVFLEALPRALVG